MIIQTSADSLSIPRTFFLFFHVGYWSEAQDEKAEHLNEQVKGKIETAVMLRSTFRITFFTDPTCLVAVWMCSIGARLADFTLSATFVCAVSYNPVA